jgi:shikimate 5-dehydrogenase
MLRSSASKIGTWQIRDKNGKVTGYNIDQDSFKKELDAMKTLTQRAITNAGGSTSATGTNPFSGDNYTQSIFGQ